MSVDTQQKKSLCRVFSWTLDELAKSPIHHTPPDTRTSTPHLRHNQPSPTLIHQRLCLPPLPVTCRHPHYRTHLPPSRASPFPSPTPHTCDPLPLGPLELLCNPSPSPPLPAHLMGEEQLQSEWSTTIWWPEGPSDGRSSAIP